MWFRDAGSFLQAPDLSESGHAGEDRKGSWVDATLCPVATPLYQVHVPARSRRRSNMSPPPDPTPKRSLNLRAEWGVLCVHFREIVDVVCVSFACASTSHSLSGSFLTSQDRFLSSDMLSFEFWPTPRAEGSDHGSFLLLIVRGISYLDC